MNKNCILINGAFIAFTACLGKEVDTTSNSVKDPASVEDSASEAPIDCALLNTDECALQTDCALINGIPMTQDPEENCFNEGGIQSFGCMDIDATCNDEVVLASSDGNPQDVVQFTSSCLPYGWLSIDFDNFEICEDDGDLSNGEAVVNEKCMFCHDSNPGIQNSANMTDEELIYLWANGYGYMPSVELTEQEILDVLAYLRATYGG